MHNASAGRWFWDSHCCSYRLLSNTIVQCFESWKLGDLHAEPLIKCLCRVVRYRKLEEEFTGSTCKGDALRQALTAEDSATNASLYILLRAVDQFYSKHRRYPGLYDQ